MNAKLTATQTAILEAAADRPDGNIEPMSASLRGGARAKVIGGLLSRGLIIEVADQHRLTEAAYAATGKQRPTDDVQKLDPTPRTIRPGTKLAGLIDALRQPGGATVNQIMAATQWQAHTVRGAISGMVKKKLGYNIVSEKRADEDRLYRIA